MPIPPSFKSVRILKRTIFAAGLIGAAGWTGPVYAASTRVDFSTDFEIPALSPPNTSLSNTVTIDGSSVKGIVRAVSVALVRTDIVYDSDLSVTLLLNPGAPETAQDRFTLQASSPRFGNAPNLAAHDIVYTDAKYGIGAGITPYVKSRQPQSEKDINTPTYANGTYTIRISDDLKVAGDSDAASKLAGWSLAFDTLTDLHWDADRDSSLAAGGSGTWKHASIAEIYAGSIAVNEVKNWRDDSTTGALRNWTNDYAFTANFGGGSDETLKTVTVDAAGVTAGALAFTNSGYTLTGGAVTLKSGIARRLLFTDVRGSDGKITTTKTEYTAATFATIGVADGKTATINAGIIAATDNGGFTSGLQKIGKGSLALGGAVTANELHINEGTVALTATGTMATGYTHVAGGTYVIEGTHTTTAALQIGTLAYTIPAVPIGTTTQTYENGVVKTTVGDGKPVEVAAVIGTLAVQKTGVLTAESVNLYTNSTLSVTETARLDTKALLIDGGRAATAAGTTLGAVSIVVQNSGILNAAGTTTFEDLTVTGGTVSLAAPTSAAKTLSVSGSSSVGIAGALTLTGAMSQTAGTTTIAGDFAAASVAHQGGTLSVSGNLGTTGATVITGGNFNIAGDIAAAGGVTMNGGTWSPGLSGTVRTVAISGNTTLGGTARTVVDIASNTSFDRVNVTGAAALGGTLLVNVIGELKTGESYTFVNATGGVTGNFTGLERAGNSPFIAVRLRSGGAAGEYETYTAFNGEALIAITSPNGATVATAIDKAYQTGTPAFKAQIDSYAEAAVTPEQANEFLNQFMPGNTMGANRMARRDAALVTDSFAGFAAGARTQAASRAFAWDRPLSGQTGYDFMEDNPVLLASTMNRTYLPRQAASPEEHRFSLWGSGSYSFNDVDQNTINGTLAREEYTAGATLGADYRIGDGDTHIGALVTFANASSKTSETAAAESAESSSIAPGLYAMASAFGLDWDLMTAFAVTGYDLSRSTPDGKAEANPDGNTALIRLGVSRALSTSDKWFLTPAASLTYAHTRIDSYAETGGGNFNLSVDEQAIDSLASHLGCSFGKEIRSGSVTWIPEARFGWGHEFHPDGTRLAVTSPFLGANNGYSLTTADAARDYMTAGAALTARINKTVTLNAAYDAQLFREDIPVEHRLSAMIRVVF